MVDGRGSALYTPWELKAEIMLLLWSWLPLKLMRAVYTGYRGATMVTGMCMAGSRA